MRELLFLMGFLYLLLVWMGPHYGLIHQVVNQFRESFFILLSGGIEKPSYFRNFFVDAGFWENTKVQIH